MSEISENLTAETEDAQMHPLEKDLDVYPLREASEDPRWAVRTVWTWVSIAVFLLLFILTLLVLGLIYD
jgi:hypothetical protein